MLTIIVIVILIVGLLLGAIGFRRNTDPPNRTKPSHYGGIMLIYWWEWVLLVIITIWTLQWSSPHVCICCCPVTVGIDHILLGSQHGAPISKDSPNDDIPSYEFCSKVINETSNTIHTRLWSNRVLTRTLLLSVLARRP